MFVARIGAAQGTCLVSFKMQPLRARLSHGCRRGMTVSPRLHLRPGSAFGLVPRSAWFRVEI
jgi:hypothetical protein